MEGGREYIKKLWVNANEAVIAACEAATAEWEARRALRETMAANPLAPKRLRRQASGEDVLAIPLGYAVISLEARKLKDHLREAERLVREDLLVVARWGSTRTDAWWTQNLRSVRVCEAAISLWTVAHEERIKTTQRWLAEHESDEDQESYEHVKDAVARFGLDHAAWNDGPWQEISSRLYDRSGCEKCGHVVNPRWGAADPVLNQDPKFADHLREAALFMNG